MKNPEFQKLLGNFIPGKLVLNPFFVSKLFDLGKILITIFFIFLFATLVLIVVLQIGTYQ